MVYWGGLRVFKVNEAHALRLEEKFLHFSDIWWAFGALMFLWNQRNNG